ncbi:putative RND superfamily exporter protein [Treponema rectale]|uniref:Putative RND superfamily exporter protein n=2 Tax=Treponema TaxID=157 RepID=A0A840SH28_9SPIR|nr:hypothetical protein [Treponema rectale]MBB5218731.1 putative RND superfamily exporter protein [Treponema rectale]
MQISNINSFFKKAGQFQLRFRWVILILICIFSIISLSGLPKLKMANNEED